MSKVRLIPYKPASKSAKTLSQALGGKRIRLQGSRYKPKPDDLVINWGQSDNILPMHKVLNSPDKIALASNKLSFFNHLEGVDYLPPFWTDAKEIPDEAFPIVCRTVLVGHSGVGIVIADGRDDLVPAPLYVKYIKKKEEYRVHVGTPDTIISIQQKKRKTEHENPNWQIRNHANGFIYARQDVEPPVGVVRCAVDCIERLGLDFGAVDVIWNQHQQKAYVLEVNTAPGIEGETVNDYARYFQKFSD